MSSAPSIGTGSPNCSKGAGRSRNRQPTQRPNAKIVGLGEGPLPTGHPLGCTLISRQQDWGTSGSQWSLWPSPCLWTPRHGQMAVWERGASCRLPRAWGEGQRCQPPEPSPTLLDSKFLSNTFWGFPQPPPQILAGRSGSPFSSPERGWNRLESWGVSEPYVWGGEWAPSGHDIFLGPGNGGIASLSQICIASATSPARPLTVFPLSHSVMVTGGLGTEVFPGVLKSLGLVWTCHLPWLMPEPFAYFLSPGAGRLPSDQCL